jgi:hypothetical protein
MAVRVAFAVRQLDTFGVLDKQLVLGTTMPFRLHEFFVGM